MILLVIVFIAGYAFGAVFLSCELGQRMNDAFGRIGIIICQCDWHLFPIEIKHMLLTILVILQQPVSMQYFGSVACNREVFKKVNLKKLNSILFIYSHIHSQSNNKNCFSRLSIAHSHILWCFVNLAIKYEHRRNASTKLSLKSFCAFDVNTSSTVKHLLKYQTVFWPYRGLWGCICFNFSPEFLFIFRHYQVKNRKIVERYFCYSQM